MVRFQHPLKNELANKIWREDFEYAVDFRESVESLDTVHHELSNGVVPCFSDDQARYGQFEELEKFLRQHDIHFDRKSDTKYEYDGETVIFRGDKEFTFFSTQEGNLLVSYDSIRAAVDIVTSKFVESIKNRNQSDIEKSFKEIECYTKNVMTDFLEKIMQIVPILPPLEPLEFVE